MSSAGTHICKAGKTLEKHMIKCTKYCYPEMSLTRRVHKSEETGAPRKMHLRIRLRAHVSASQRKQSRRTCT